MEYTNQHGLTNPSCAEVACYWSLTSKNNIEPARVKDINLQAHKKEGQLRVALSMVHLSKSLMRDVSEQEEHFFLASVRKTLPNAVLNITYSPPSEEDAPYIKKAC